METKATSKGQIVIPADLRRRFGIKAGTRVSIHVDEKENAIVLKPITREFIVGLRGIDQGKEVLQALVEERRLDNKREEQALKRISKKSKGKR
jgi:AbrB family looped-hinge helix DNA binding protein